MRKKIVAFIAVAGLAALPVFALADTSIPTGVQAVGGTITSAYCDGSIGPATWLEITEGATTTRYFQTSGGCFNVTGVSVPFNAGDDIEGNLRGYPGNTYVFGILNAPATPAGLSVSIPTSTAPALTATIGSQLADPGTLLVVGLVVGVPLTFYVIQQMIALLPGNSKNRRG